MVGSDSFRALRIDGSIAASKLFNDCFLWSGFTVEKLWVAHVNERKECLHLECYDGDPTSAPLPLFEIISGVAKHRSKGLVLAHNHPSGDPTPSPSDCRSTRRLAVTVEAMGCEVLDHLIFAEKRWTSFRDMGLL